MTIVGSFRAGKTSRITAGGTALTRNTYRVTHSGTREMTTNFECNGFRQAVLGDEGLDWTISGDWDADQNPVDDPPGFYPREDGANLVIYTRVSDGDNYNMPIYFVTSGELSSSATGKVSVSATGASQGTFTIP